MSRNLMQVEVVSPQCFITQKHFYYVFWNSWTPGYMCFSRQPIYKIHIIAETSWSRRCSTETVFSIQGKETGKFKLNSSNATSCTSLCCLHAF